MTKKCDTKNDTQVLWGSDWRVAMANKYYTDFIQIYTDFNKYYTDFYSNIR